MEPEQDLVFLREAVPDLQDFLLSREVYWPLRSAARLSGDAQLPQLSIGNLAFCKARLAPVKLPSDQKEELSRLLGLVQKVRSDWLSNWRIKAGREFNARLHLWQHFLDDLRGDLHQHAAFFRREIRNRALLRLLQYEEEGEISPSDVMQLDVLDQILRGITSPGSFVWEPEISAGFPPEKFWFLYVSLPSSK